MEGGLTLAGQRKQFTVWPLSFIYTVNKTVLMAKNKKSFILYTNWRDAFEHLPNDKAGELIKHIFSYVNDEDPKSDDLLINAVFATMKNQLKEDLIKWEKQQEQRIAAGRKSAEKRQAKLNDRSTTVDEKEQASTVNVNGNVNVNANVLLEKETKFIFKKALIDFGFEKELVEDWLKVRKTKKARNTRTAYEGFVREVQKCKLDKNEILRECVERSWSGFKSDWMNQKTLENENSKKGNGDISQALHNYINS